MSTPTIPPVSSTPAKTPGNLQVVQIISLPDALQNNARAIRLEGEVVQQNKDGSVRIRTPEGDIDVQIRGKQPQPGQKMEVEIPAGSPPRNATVRPAPVMPQPLPQQPLPPTSQPNVSLPQTPVTKPAPMPPGQTPPPVQGTTPPPATPVGTKPAPLPAPEKPAGDFPDVFQPTQQTSAQKPLPSLPPLTPGQIVKLVPMIPLAETPQAVTSPKVTAQTTLIAQKSEGNLISALLQAVKSVLPQSAAPQTGNILQSTDKPLAQTPMLIPQQPITLAAKVISLTLPSGQTLAMPQTTSVPVPFSPASLTMPTPQAPIQTPLTPPVINITVAEVTPQNQPVIPVPMNDKGAVQNFILQSPPASVPVGTQITLQPQLLQTPEIKLPISAPSLGAPAIPVSPASLPVTAPATALPPAWRAILPLMQPSTLWPTMDEIFQTFYQATPQAAQIMGRTIPSPSNGANFGPAIMLFAAALKSGDLQAWMGDRKLDMIQKLGKESLMSRLSGETSSLATNADAASSDWKSFPIPLLWQNEISKIMFHVRKEPSEKDQEQGEGGTRFVMDLELTRMGDVQLDGMVRGKQLDLVIRTQLPVSASMQDAMRTAYAKALDGSDIFGDIGFQSDGKGWENIIKEEDLLTASI